MIEPTSRLGFMVVPLWQREPMTGLIESSKRVMIECSGPGMCEMESSCRKSLEEVLDVVRG